MKLYFNHNTKTIIVEHNEFYYDMRSGKLICHTSLFSEHGILPSPLRPFNREFTTKLIEDNEFIERIKKLIPFSYIEYGYKFMIDNHELYLSLEGNKFRLSGKFPYYFLKSIIQFIKNIER